jgi:hypothetical protein
MAKVSYRRKLTEWQTAQNRLQTVVQKMAAMQKRVAEMNCRNGFQKPVQSFVQ